MLLLEVVLITTGVFLGLLGEQWREDAEHRKLAAAALKQFRSEFAQNREEVARVHQAHLDQVKALEEYFRVNGVDSVLYEDLMKNRYDELIPRLDEAITDAE
jgi:hypothetical protein